MISEIEQKIKEWGDRTKLRSNGTLQAQGLKLISEFGEVANAIRNKNIDELRDGIGDMFVVMFMLEGIYQKEFQSSKELEYPSQVFSLIQQDNKTKMLIITEKLGELTDAILKKQDNIINIMSQIAEELVELANINGLSIEECLKQAYNDIKDREGILTPDGVFVKSSDPEYQRIKEMYS